MMMKPDVQIEKDAVTELISTSLQPEQIQHLQQVVTADPMLGSIMDTLLTRMSEFTGTGPVDGPGSTGEDSVPSRLDVGEFVFSAKAVEAIGVDVLQRLMEEAEAEADVPQEAAKEVSRQPMPSLLEKDV